MTITTGTRTSQGRSREDFVPGLAFHRGIQSLGRGSAAVSITVGGIRVHLHGLNASQANAVRERFGVFATAATNAVSTEFTIDVATFDNETFLAMRGTPAELYRIRIAENEGVLATSHEWSCWFDEASGCGTLALAFITTGDPRAFDRALENFLRVLYAHTLLGRDSFLLHSAGLVRDGRAYLFFGPSGSGKTTVTTLSPEATVLSDDLTLVKVVEHDGRLSCYSSSVPFRGVFAPRPERETLYPVVGFFRLVQDTEDSVVPLSGARAVGEVVASLPFVTERPERAGRAIDVVSKAVAAAPVSQLHFRKDRTFWNVIGERA